MRTLRTLVLAVTTLASACGHNAGHANSTVARKAASETADIYTPAQQAVLNQVKSRGQLCWGKYEGCRKQLVERGSTEDAAMTACIPVRDNCATDVANELHF